MISAAYHPNRHEAANTPRLTITLCVVLAVHLLPLFLMTMPPPPILPPDEAVTIRFDGTALDAMAAPLEPAKVPKPLSPAAVMKPEEAEPAKAAPPQAQPAQLPPKAPAPPAPNAKPEKRELVERDLPPLVEKPMVAFDESKSTAKPPLDAYLSDRNSTAADRGPKNLPRGDPYVDKGQTDIVRYLQNRGEGNVPAFATSATSGSVKKEGAPKPGEGARVEEKLLQRGDAEHAESAEKKNNIEPSPPSLSPRRSDDVAKESTVEHVPDAGSGPQSSDAKNAAIAENDYNKESLRLRVEVVKEFATKPNPDAELEAFAALLESPTNSQLSGKPGALNREGQAGHEGDGTLRPGHNEAVSDVTNFNLQSSAEESDDPRFAKRADPMTAYVKPFFRRTDGKWKAEIAARNRWRPVRGIVTIQITVNKDGKLLDTKEMERQPKELIAEYVAIAEHAIKAAADPDCGPFPTGLAGRDAIVFSFSFHY